MQEEGKKIFAKLTFCLMWMIFALGLLMASNWYNGTWNTEEVFIGTNEAGNPMYEFVKTWEPTSPNGQFGFILCIIPVVFAPFALWVISEGTDW